jgi:hypothetical protein
LTDVSISSNLLFTVFLYFVAQEPGWFEEFFWNIYITVYSSGAPQIEDALSNHAWDFGILGFGIRRPVPAAIGGSQGILTIGINKDQSAVSEVVDAPGVVEWPPKSLEDGMFGATPKFIGALLLLECLIASGINFTESNIFYGSQSELDESIKEESTPYAALWAPTYSYAEASDGARSFCTGLDAQQPIFGGLVARESGHKIILC